MARKRRGPDADDKDFNLAGGTDPLGKVLQKYEVSLAGVLLVSGALGVVGLGVTGYAFTRQPYSVGLLIVGGVLLLLAVMVLVLNVFNVGRRLEVRKHGLRLVEAGVQTDLRWDEIADIEIDRTDDTYLGVASVRRRSSDASGLSGPLTKTEWDVTIRGHDGRSIRLSPTFLRTVRDPKKLIAQLRMRTGLR